MHQRCFVATVLAMFLVATAAWGEETASRATGVDSTPQATTAEGVRRALVICGLSGDADHRKLFADSLEMLYAGLTTHRGFRPENVIVLWGDEPQESDGPAVRASRAVASSESIKNIAESLAKEVGPQDSLWVFVLGHSHYDGRYSWLNLAGDDLHHQQFGQLFEGIRCREQAFFITTAASGFYLKPLAAAGRIVITATEPDLEVNETLFPHKLARAIGAPPPYLEFDQDRDGRLSLLDVYLWTTRETAQDYLTAELLATEHSLLDDTGDGRGTEVQADYLPEELGGKMREGSAWPASPKGDGAIARQIWLAYPPSPPVPDESLADAP